MAASAVAFPPSEELLAAILTQVEFYFSDANLATDKFLLKLTGKNGMTPVPLSVIAGFKRMKGLTLDLGVIVQALQTSDKIQVSGEGDAVAVGRIEPLGSVNLEAVKSRTVVAEHVTIEPLTIDSVKTCFSKCGNVLLVRIITPPAIPIPGTLGPDGLPIPVTAAAITGMPPAQQHPFKNDPILQKIIGTFVLVEFEKEEEAVNAAETLTETNSWRGGMRVRVLGKTKGKKKTPVKSSPTAARPPLPSATTPNAPVAAGGSSKEVTAEDLERIANYKGFRRRDLSPSASPAAPSAPGSSSGINTPADGSTPRHTPRSASMTPRSASAAAMAAAPGCGPKGPDGTKGFAAGRGRAIVVA